MTINQWRQVGNMWIFECQQGSPEWFQARCGIPTASRFNDIYGVGLDKRSSRERYANELIAEVILQHSVDNRSPTQQEERGTMMEHEASDSYAFKNDCHLLRAGFITNKSKTVGCSLDRLVVKDPMASPYDIQNIIRAAEFKCPGAGIHMRNYFTDKIVEKDHVAQVQGQIFVTGLDEIDWYSYYPGLPPKQIRTERAPAYQIALGDALEEFRDIMGQKVQVLVDRGIITL